MSNTGIVDTHVHVWDLKRFRYTWLDGDEHLERDFSIADYREATAGANVEQIVFMQAAVLPEQAFAETEWVNGLADTVEPRITGIIPDAPVENGAAVADHLDRLTAIPRVRGIRRLIQIDPDPPALARRPSFIEGVRLLRDYGYTFDVCIQRDTLPAATELVEACPDVQFVLDHVDNPNTPDGETEPWMGDIARMAKHENVVCKLSGMMSLAAQGWTVDDLKPYALHVLESFGADRVMYGSDWPVLTLTGEYGHWVGAVESFLEGASESERRAVLHDNAIRIYRLNG